MENIGKYDRRLMCNLIEARRARNHTVVLMLRDLDCCHMPGAIAVARKLDPAVERIYTFSGDRPDTVYVRTGDDWTAYLAR